VVHLQNFVLTVLVWCVPPFTMGLFWLRSLQRHDWILTGFQMAVVVMAIVCAAGFQKRCKLVLQGSTPEPISFRQGFWKRMVPYTETLKRGWKLAGITLVALSLTWVVSDGAINGVRTEEDNFGIPQIKITQTPNAQTENANVEDFSAFHHTIVPRLLPYLGARAFADLTEADLSTKPENWFVARAKDAEGKEIKSLEVINGAQLRGADLRNAEAEGAFLAKADLRAAKLQGSNLSYVQLQGADLSSANLQGAYLRSANLQGANLEEANLQEANLSAANLQGASLHRANLQGAFLGDAQLQGADLSSANLQGASLPFANLQGANLLGAGLQGASLREANLQEALLGGAMLRIGMSMVGVGFGTNLRGATLTNVMNLTQEQLNRACVDEHTELPEHLTPPKPCPKGLVISK